MELHEAREKLYSNNFGEYRPALVALRDTLTESVDPQTLLKSLDEDDMTGVLRPYCWYLHAPGFQDIYDTFERFMLLMQKHSETFLTSSDAGIKEDFVNLVQVGADYLDAGEVHPSKWQAFFVSAPLEVMASTALGHILDHLEKAGADETETAPVRQLSGILLAIEEARHDSYQCCRVMGAHFLPVIRRYISGFNGTAQSFLLHALDAFPKNEAVILFYEDYIRETPSKELQDVARKYLGRVK